MLEKHLNDPRCRPISKDIKFFFVERQNDFESGFGKKYRLGLRPRSLPLFMGWIHNADSSALTSGFILMCAYLFSLTSVNLLHLRLWVLNDKTCNLRHRIKKTAVLTLSDTLKTILIIEVEEFKTLFKEELLLSRSID